MEEMMDMMDKEPKGGDKLKEVAAHIKSVAKEMGIAPEALLEKLEPLCASESGEPKLEIEIGSEDESEEPKEDVSGKKALVIAMMKKKNGKMDA